MKKRILVVDDEPAFVQMFGRAMPDYEVRVEGNPTEAINAVREFRPDVLLLDLVMLIIPGNVLAKEIKSHPDLHNIPITFVSAMVHDWGQGEEPVWIGRYPAFGKPFNLGALRECIMRQIAVIDSSDYGVQRMRKGHIAGS
jgi:DNA-binding response OmpR family regulator